MAKKKNQSNNGGGDGNDHDGTGNKQKATVVLKMDLHCEGCAGKIVRAVRTLDGVESVRIGDSELNKITVIGNVDPVKLRQKVEEKTKKKVEVIYPAIKKPNHTTQSDGGENNKEKQQKPPEQKSTVGKKDEKKPKELPVTTAVLKVPLHCQGCVRRIRSLVSKTKGYLEMSLDKNKDLVTVKGAIDMKLLAEALQHKLKRAVEIIPPKKDSGEGEKKGNGGGGENIEKKKKKGGGGISEGAAKGGNGGGEKKGGVNGAGGAGNESGDKMEMYKMEGYGGMIGYPYPEYAYGSGYADNVHAPQLFSDENPNACVVM